MTDTEVAALRALLKEARTFIPKHDGYAHNDYLPEERASCKVCQLRKRIDAALKEKQ